MTDSPWNCKPYESCSCCLVLDTRQRTKPLYVKSSENYFRTLHLSPLKIHLSFSNMLSGGVVARTLSTDNPASKVLNYVRANYWNELELSLCPDVIKFRNICIIVYCCCCMHNGMRMWKGAFIVVVLASSRCCYCRHGTACLCATSSS